MAGISENDGVLNAKDYSAFKERSIRTKFLWQILAGIGGATFFALLNGVGTALLTAKAGTDVLALAGGMIFSPVGLAFITIGVVGIYFAQRYYFQSCVLDQDFQAKKIAAATGKGKDSPETQVALAVERQAAEKPKTLPPGMSNEASSIAEEASEEAQTQDEAKTQWAAKFAKDEVKPAPAKPSTEKKPENWQGKLTTAHDNAHAVTTPVL